MAEKSGIIGRVAVKVTPDLDGFYEKVKTELEAIEKKLDSIKIDLDVDSALVEKELDKLNGRKIQIDIDLDQAALDEIETRLRDIELELDPKLNETELRKIRREIEALLDREFKINAQLEVEQNQLTRRRLERELEDIEDRLEKLKNTEAEIHPSTNMAALKYVQGRLAWLGRPRTVDFVPKVNKAAAAQVATALAALSGLRGLDKTFDKFTDWLKNLDKTAPIIAGVSGALLGLSGWLSTAASNVFALIYNLGEMSALALVLPGILGGLAIGVGTTVAVFKDFNEVLPEVKERLADLQDRMSAIFWEEAKKPIEDMINVLFPEFARGLEETSKNLGVWYGGLAEALGTALGDGALQRMFEDLNESILIAEEATGSLAEIIRVLGEVGAGYLPRLAEWFVEISDSFSNWLTEAEADGRLNEWIDTAIFQMQELYRAIEETVGIFAGLGRAALEAGGSSLTDFADTLAAIHETIDSPAFQTGFITFLTASHDMMTQIADLSGPAFSQMFASLAKLSETVFPSVGSSLGLLMRSFAQVFDNPKFQSGIANMMAGFEDLVGHLSGAVGPISSGFGSIMTIIGKLASNFGQVLVPALETFMNIVDILTPAINPLIDALGGQLTSIIRDLGPIFEDAAKQIKPLIDAFTDIVQDVGPMISPVLTPLVSGFTDLGIAFATKLLPHLQPLFERLLEVADVLGGELLSAATILMGPLTDLGIVLVESFLTAVEALAPYIPTIAEAFADLVEAVIPLIEPMSQLGVEFLPLVVMLFENLVGKVIDILPHFVALVESFSNFAGTVLPALVPALQFVLDFFWTFVEGIIDGATQVITGVVDVISGVWETFAGLFTGDWERMWNGIKEIGQGIWDIIVGAFEVFMNWGILGIFKKIGLGLLKTGWKTLWTGMKKGGKAVWDGISKLWSGFMNGLKSVGSKILEGIKSAWNTGWTWTKTKASGIWDSIKSLWSTFWSNVKSKASSMMESVKSAISSGWQKIKDVFSNTFDVIKIWFDTFKSNLRTKAKEAMDWLKERIDIGIEKVKTVFKDLPGNIKSWIGNVKNLLWQVGKDIMNSLWNGLKNVWGNVKSWLGGLGGKIINLKGPPAKDKVLLRDNGELIMEGFLKALKSGWADVEDYLKMMSKEIGNTEFETPGVILPVGDMPSARNARRIAKGFRTIDPVDATGKVFNYYAAPNASLDAEEELFEAMNRGRAML